MSDQVALGRVRCDFLDRSEFVVRCRQWLQSGSLHHVVTLNPEMVMAADRDTAFRNAVRQAQLRVPDGAGLIWARWYLRSRFWPLWPSLLAFLFQPVERITGVESVLTLARLCAAAQQPLYLLGGTTRQRSQTAQRLRSTFQDIVVFESPDHQFDIDGPSVILADIDQRQPAVLLVAYGAPKQTLWIEAQRRHLPSVRIAMGVGGAFAMLSEDLPRAPRLLRRLNLEWLWRLYLEPRRWPRIAQATLRFPLRMRQQKMTSRSQ